MTPWSHMILRSRNPVLLKKGYYYPSVFLLNFILMEQNSPFHYIGCTGTRAKEYIRHVSEEFVSQLRCWPDPEKANVQASALEVVSARSQASWRSHTEVCLSPALCHMASFTAMTKEYGEQAFGHSPWPRVNWWQMDTWRQKVKAELNSTARQIQGQQSELERGEPATSTRPHLPVCWFHGRVVHRLFYANVIMRREETDLQNTAATRQLDLEIFT